jgi:nucleotide-binding universal stress UspA family protein
MYKHIVVGTDGSATATKAVEAAATIAADKGARLHVAVAFSQRQTSREKADIEGAPVEERWRLLPGPAAERVGERAASLARDAAGAPIDVDVHCVLARPVDAIVDLARHLDADLVVVGNRGMNGRGRIFGSVPRAVSHRSPCDVLVVDTVGRRARGVRPAA